MSPPSCQNTMLFVNYLWQFFFLMKVIGYWVIKSVRELIFNFLWHQLGCLSAMGHILLLYFFNRKFLIYNTTNQSKVPFHNIHFWNSFYLSFENWQPYSLLLTILLYNTYSETRSAVIPSSYFISEGS